MASTQCEILANGNGEPGPKLSRPIPEHQWCYLSAKSRSLQHKENQREDDRLLNWPIKSVSYYDDRPPSLTSDLSRHYELARCLGQGLPLAAPCPALLPSWGGRTGPWLPNPAQTDPMVTPCCSRPLGSPQPQRHPDAVLPKKACCIHTLQHCCRVSCPTASTLPSEIVALTGFTGRQGKARSQQQRHSVGHESSH